MMTTISRWDGSSAALEMIPGKERGGLEPLARKGKENENFVRSQKKTKDTRATTEF